MELFPTGKTLRLICLGAFGPYEVVMTVDQMIPITDHDYAKKHYVGLGWLDLDRVREVAVLLGFRNGVRTPRDQGDVCV